VATNDRSVFPPSEEGLDEAELAEAPLEGVELVVADPARVRRIRPKVVDRDLFDSEGGERGLCPSPSQDPPEPTPP
jgi:hypothetical protein